MREKQMARGPGLHKEGFWVPGARSPYVSPGGMLSDPQVPKSTRIPDDPCQDTVGDLSAFSLLVTLWLPCVGLEG